jgi:hypothetical protein
MRQPNAATMFHRTGDEFRLHKVTSKQQLETVNDGSNGFNCMHKKKPRNRTGNVNNRDRGSCRDTDEMMHRTEKQWRGLYLALSLCVLSLYWTARTPRLRVLL